MSIQKDQIGNVVTNPDGTKSYSSVIDGVTENYTMSADGKTVWATYSDYPGETETFTVVPEGTAGSIETFPGVYGISQGSSSN